MIPLQNEIFGVAFAALALVLTFLMFYLWKYPYDKERHISAAPKSLVRIHRLLGYVFVAVYLYLMWDMVPRLWNYQVELPARTVAHLLLGMAIGAILVIKIAVVRFFKHMEATLAPMLGTGLLVCTMLLIGLALPTALRETFLHDNALVGGNMTAERLARVRDQLPKAGIEDPADIERLGTERSLVEGRAVLVAKCVQCHDLRTILVRPRTPQTWRQTVERMANRATVLQSISKDEQLKVTAYLIAISPTLQRSAFLRRQQDMQAARTEKALEATMTMMSKATPAAQPVDLAMATETFQSRCSQCHSPVLVQANPPRTAAAATMLVMRMVRNGLQAGEDELAQILSYLTQTYATVEPSSEATSSPSQTSSEPSSKMATDTSAASPAAASSGDVDEEIVVRPAGTELRFEPAEIQAKAGKRLRVVLDNPAESGITHNFVLVRESDVYDEVSTGALGAVDRGFVPLHEQVIAGVPAQPAGSRGAIEFVAPAPGRYKFGCMMPGHSFTMYGALVVTE